MGPFLYASKIIIINCDKRKEEEKYLLKNLLNCKNNTHINRIGYPITIGNTSEIVGKPAMYSNTLLEFVTNNSIIMDDEEQLSKLNEYQKPEVIVEFNENPYGKIKININYKEFLAKERKIKERNEPKNVLFIYMDNLSRNHFYRQYPKTSKFLKKFLSFNGFTPKNYKFKGATLQNAIPMFSCVSFDSNANIVSIVRDFKKKRIYNS